MRTVALLAAAGLATTAMADEREFVIDIEDFGGSSEVVADINFDLPAIQSIDSIAIDLAHSWASDIELILTTPGGMQFIATDDNGTGVLLGDGGSSLDGTGRYTFLPADGRGNWSDFGFGEPAPEGEYDADQWLDGPFDGGTWNLFLNDDAGGDDGAVGSIVVGFTVPAPASLALLGLGGLAATRRRR